MAMLWQVGLSPNFSITILSKSKNEMLVKVNGQEKTITKELAEQVTVVKIG